MKIGDKVVCWISDATLHGQGDRKKKAKGTVIYIHPDWRFYRVRFEFGPGRTLIEAFFPEDVVAA